MPEPKCKLVGDHVINRKLINLREGETHGKGLNITINLGRTGGIVGYLDWPVNPGNAQGTLVEILSAA